MISDQRFTSTRNVALELGAVDADRLEAELEQPILDIRHGRRP